MPRPPLVLVDQYVICSACDAEVRVVTDGLSAYAEASGSEWSEEGGTRTGTVVEVLCPAQHPRDGFDRCHEILSVDLSAEGAWEPATTEGLSRLSLAGRLDG